MISSHYNNLPLGLFFVSFLFAVNPSFATEPDEEFYEYPISGVLLGQGWNNFDKTAAPNVCVGVEEYELEKTSYRTLAKEIKSKSSLFKESSMAVAASYSGGGMTASGSVETARSMKFETDRYYFLFQFNSNSSSTFALPAGSKNLGKYLEAIEKSKDVLTQVKNSQIPELLFHNITSIHAHTPKKYEFLPPFNLVGQDQISIADFTKLCGHGFVSGIYRGSEAQVVLQSKSTKREDIESAKIAVSGSGMGYSGSVNYSSGKKEVSEDSEINTVVLQEGGYPIAPPSSIKDLKDLYSNIGVLLDKPVAYKIRITPYSKIVTGTESAFLADEFGRLTQYYIVLRDLHDQATNILQGYISNEVKGAILPKDKQEYFNPLVDSYSDRYSESSVSRSGYHYMLRLVGDLENHLGLVESAIEACQKDITICNNFESILAKIAADLEARKNVVILELQKQVENELIALANEAYTDISSLIEESVFTASSTTISAGDIGEELEVFTDNLTSLQSNLLTMLGQDNRAFEPFNVEAVQLTDLSNLTRDVESNSEIVQDFQLSNQYLSLGTYAANFINIFNSIDSVVDKASEEALVDMLEEVRSKIAIWNDIDKIVDLYQDDLNVVNHAYSFYGSIKTSEDIEKQYYPKIYEYLVRMPLPDSLYELGLNTKHEKVYSYHKKGKYSFTKVKTTAVGALTPIQKQILNNPTDVLHGVLMADRLIPWHSYFCSDNLNDPLCIGVGDLENYLEEISIDEPTIKDILTANAEYSRFVGTQIIDKGRRGGLYKW